MEPRFDMQRLIVIGARLRLVELDAQCKELEAFLDSDAQPSTPRRTDIPRKIRKPRKRRRTAEQRAATSRAMKASWSRRRKLAARAEILTS